MPTRRALLLGVPAAAVAAPSASDADASFTFWHEDTILLPAEVRGRPYTALLDTGAAGVLLDSAAARALGLRPSGELGLSTATRSIEAFTLGAETIEVAGEKLEVERLLTQDLRAIALAMGHPVEILIGEELFARFAVRLDFTRQRIRCEPAGTANGPGTLAPLRPGPQGRRLIELRLEGGKAIPAVFDLGSSMPLMMSRRYAETIGLFDGRKTSTAAIAQLSGVGVSTTLSVRELWCAGSSLSDVPAEVLDDWRLEAVPVVLGLPALAQFRLTVDYAADAVFAAADPFAAQRPILRDLSGLGFAVLPDRLQVVHVARDGPAEDAWQVGDEIIAVNGRRIDNAYGRFLWRWRSGGLGPSARLTLAGGATRLLELKRYY